MQSTVIGTYLFDDNAMINLPLFAVVIPVAFDPLTLTGGVFHVGVGQAFLARLAVRIFLTPENRGLMQNS